MVVCLRSIHPLRIFPSKVSQEAEAGYNNGHEVEDRGGEEAGHDTLIFAREAKFRRRDRVGGDEDEPDYHGAWDGEEGVFGPDVGDESCFAEDGGEDGGVESGAPDPVAGLFAVGLGEVPIPD